MHGSPSSVTPRGTPSRRGKSPRVATPSPAQSGSNSLPPDFNSKPTSTFFSCLAIPVEGAIPIDPDSTDTSRAPPATPVTESTSKRAPRKSKTDALAALTSRDRSSSRDPDEFGFGDNLTERYRNARPIPITPTLDLSSVKTSSPRDYTAPTDRPFGLQNCPEYHPTAEEFKDPMAYVRSISEEASQYGICKVVPPEGWEMPFVTDTEKFRFKTRLQRLNSIEASSRAKLNFLEQLYRFHKQQGNPRVVVPTINHKPLDLWLLRKEVQKLGGYEAVSQAKKWSDLSRILGYRGVAGLAGQIKNSYTRVILPYEHFCERARTLPTPAPGTRDTPSKALNGHTPSKLSRLSATVTNAGDASAPSSPLTNTSSPLSEPPEEREAKKEMKDGDNVPSASARPRRSTRVTSQEQSGETPKKAVVPPVFHDKNDVKSLLEQHCEICSKKNRGEAMLLCDGCDSGFHTFCLDPPLDVIPNDQWFCFACLSGTGGDFGFDEGDEHSLSSFQARDTEFRRAWFETHPPHKADDAMAVDDSTASHIGGVTVSEYDLENEFWRLVESPHDTVEIEYGADVHSTTHGSAMPTVETHPLDSYSKDPWNLNNIPIVSDSLLRFIKSDISGMTVPWTYVGMTFSTFCWHNEDHYTYSINYMHWGETKTWYGIPGEDAEKFEAAIKSEAPDLFEAQPDLLFQLVTLMNPKRVTNAGVRVYACNQRAGEFVVTFPKSYHAGFNHGLNFNEAVNFALPNWLPYGRDCVSRYREHRKPPVFSHDELLITITQQSQSIKTAIWLIDSLKEMTTRELDDRAAARQLNLTETLVEEDRPEEEYQCTVCKVFCYLSQVTCPCSSKVACVEHADLLCRHNAKGHLTFRKRFSDEELIDIQSRVAERAAIPSSWQGKLSKLLMESPRPALRSLRALLAEGERVNFYLPEIANLRKCVARANEWVESANSFTIRKQSRKRSRRSRGRQDLTATSADDPGDRPERTLEDLYALLKDVENLGFDCPEIATLRSLAQQAEDMKVKAAALLGSPDVEKDRDEFVNECKRLLIDGSSLNVLLNELLEVEKIVDREQLIQELEEKLDDGDNSMTLEEVRQLLIRGQACNLGPDNKHMKLLEERERAGDGWEDKAQRILSQTVKTISELDDFANMDSYIPIDPTVLDRLMSARAKAKDFEKQAKAWLSPEADAPRPRPQDVMRLVSRAEKDFSISAVDDLRRVATIAIDLETRCEQAIKGRHPRVEGEDALETMRTWKAYTRDHLSIFQLPMFEKLDSQLKLHNEWVEDLPWWCRNHKVAHGQAILDDVIESTRPEDDMPPSDEYFTCICNTPVRPPPPGVVSDAVQCDHCFARFHGECAKNGGSCPFCDHHHWDGEIRKDRSWHFCYLPEILNKAPEISRNYSEDWKQLEIIVHRVNRLSGVISQFLAYVAQPANRRPELIHQVRHHMRKLYKIQFAVSSRADISLGWELASLHRVLAGRPEINRTKKRRRPKFAFGQDVDADWVDGTRCICRGRTDYLRGARTIRCESCQKMYHQGCVFYPPGTTPAKGYVCPLCCLRKTKIYPYSEIRVVMAGPQLGVDSTYVDTKRMIETFSKDIIYITLDRPYRSTLFVEIVRFYPGQPELGSNGAHDRAVTPPPRRHSTVSDVRPSSSPKTHTHMQPHDRVSIPMSATAPPIYNTSSSGQHAPPPPPWMSAWSRWGQVATPAIPPSTQRRQSIDSVEVTSQSSRKRSFEDQSQPADDIRQASSSSSSVAPSPKRRLVAAPLPPFLPPVNSHPLPPPQSRSSHQTPPPVLPPPRTVQTLSPSLALIMSPPLDHLSSPRTLYSTSSRDIPPRSNSKYDASPPMRPMSMD